MSLKIATQILRIIIEGEKLKMGDIITKKKVEYLAMISHQLSSKAKIKLQS
jgi:hypothetical protein